MDVGDRKDGWCGRMVVLGVRHRGWGLGRKGAWCGGMVYSRNEPQSIGGDGKDG